jgi:prolyl 4-hydroxylase
LQQRTVAPGEQEPWLEQLSWHPRAWLYHGFMSREECEHLIEKVRRARRRCVTVLLQR